MNAEKLFGLSDPEYWSDPWRSLQQVAWDRIDRMRSDIAIDCPDRISLEEHSSFPLLALQTGPTRDLLRPRFVDHAVVTAMSLEDDRLYAARAFTDILPAEDRDEPSPGFAALEFDVDLREALSIPWKQGRFVVRAFLRDRVSNACGVTLGPSPSSYDDPEVRRFVEEARGTRPRRDVFPPPGDPVVDYTPRVGHLPPEQIGLAIRGDRVVARRPGARARVEVSFRLPVRPTDVWQAPPDREQPSSQRAVAAISLLVIGSDAPAPIAMSLRAPSYHVEGAPGAPVATGGFTVDLLRLAGVADRCQTYFVYALAGENLAGPALVAIVDEPAS